MPTFERDFDLYPELQCSSCLSDLSVHHLTCTCGDSFCDEAICIAIHICECEETREKEYDIRANKLRDA